MGFKKVLQNFFKARVLEGSDKGSMKDTVRQRRETLHHDDDAFVLGDGDG